MTLTGIITVWKST